MITKCVISPISEISWIAMEADRSGYSADVHQQNSTAVTMWTFCTYDFEVGIFGVKQHYYFYGFILIIGRDVQSQFDPIWLILICLGTQKL